MVAGKLLVRARYPGTGRVRVLLVGRLMWRERSAARATTKRTRSEANATRQTTANAFADLLKDDFTGETPGKGCTIGAPGQANSLIANKMGFAGVAVSVKRQLFHGIMLAVARPQLRAIHHRSSRDQRVTYFHAVTLAILMKIIASLPTRLVVDGRAKESAKEIR